ncbi:MAG: hypothetical protein NTW52_01255 [Planctomycetota bacterium]|nr:hypothetical protein [Planctomycetota bacterium]
MLKQNRNFYRYMTTVILVNACFVTSHAFSQSESTVPSTTGDSFRGVSKPDVSKTDVSKPDVPSTLPTEAKTKNKPHSLRFSFDRASWREVFSWLADESELALHITEVPGGTFSYIDPSEYSITSAIDRVNMFLLPDGFTLVRSKGLLSVVNLRDPRSLQRLDAMARVVPVNDLASLDDHEIVKCFFPANELRASDAASELVRLQLITTPVVLEASNQISVIETARKLRSVQDLLAAMSLEMTSKQSLVRPFTLRHVDLEGLLTVARPHLNIEPGMTRGPELNISSDESRKNLFASGTSEALKLLEGIIAVVDVPDGTKTDEVETQILRSHRVRDQNLISVFDVLQTVLNGKSIRLSMEPSTNTIVALADEAIHKTIESTIKELEGLENVFVIIPLQTIDPYFTITLLDEMFELKSPTNLLNKRAIKIDADPAGRSLFIRGPQDKVEEIQKVVEDLDQKGSKGSERVVPVFGAKAKSLLEQAESTWQGNNPIRQFDKSNNIQAEVIERTIHAEDEPKIVVPANEIESEPKAEASNSRGKKNQQPSRTGEFISARNEPTTGTESQTTESQTIEAKITARGIVLQSDDGKGLDSFESHLRALTEGDESSKVETVVYYLKYCNADEATQLIADLLDGTSSVINSSLPAKLVKGATTTTKSPAISSSDIRSTKDGSMLVTSGSLTIIADARLNRLICVGNTSDLKLVEQYLAVIDKDTSLTSIEIHGVSHILELKHAKANEIADVIRDTYGDRVAMNTEQKKAQQTQRANDKERGANGPENKIQTSRNQEPQMSIAVHEVSNSIIVTAPETLFQEIKQLIEKLDQQSEQAVEVIYYPSAEGIGMLREALQLKGSPIKPRATTATPTKPK